MKKLLTIAAASLMTQYAFADSQPRPLTCPTIADLKKVISQLDVEASKRKQGEWHGFLSPTTLGTKLDWTLFTTDMKNDSPDEARKDIGRLFSKVYMTFGPEPIGMKDGVVRWTCMYYKEESEGIVIMTPVTAYPW